ncbi:MAG: AMP-binding protein [Spirochaetales bacterium]|nr:AMP-binding protein [Spirochaetales bacterium]
MAKKPKHNPKPWGFLDEFRGEGKLFNAEWPTLNEQFDITVARFPNNKAFEVFTPKHELFTYKEAQTIIKGVANKLYEMGVRHGDKVGLTGKNSPEWAMAYLAIAYAGATIVPVDYTLGDDVIAHLLTFAEAKVLFIDNEKIDRVNIDIPKISLDGDGENSLFGMQSAKSHKIELSSSKDIAAILFTSGTTGTPKGVMLSHENLTSDVWQAQGLMNIYDDDVFYAILPIHHAYTMLAVFLESISSGSKLVFGKKLIVKQLLKELQQGEVTMFLGVPMLFNKLIAGIMKGVKEKGAFVNGLIHAMMGISGFLKKTFGLKVGKKWFNFLLKKVSLDKIRICISGGGPLPASTFKQFNQLGIDFVQGYGLTETSPIINLNPIFDYIESSVGKTIPGVEEKIVDPDSDGNGLIYIKGSMVMQGYYKNPEATAEILSSDGWLNTGDIGHLDHRNYLYLTGRQRNIIVTEGGKNVFPEEIEDSFQLYDDIDQICVRGYVADAAKKVEGIMAIVHPSDACAEKYKDDLKGLLDHIGTIITEVNATFPSYKKIRKLALYMEKFPVSSTAKIQRFKIGDIDENLTKMI